MSADVGRATREYRLDDDSWRFRKERARHVTRWAPALLTISLVCLGLGILLWGFVLPRFALLVFFGFGFMVSSIAFLVRPNEPTRMVLDSGSITLYRANGKESILPLRSGSSIELYDSTPLDSNQATRITLRSGEPIRGERLLLYGRSLRNEPIQLTEEAYLAVRAEMEARHAVVLREGPISKGSTTLLARYRLR